MVLEKIRNHLEPFFFTILRVSTGFTMAAHGWMKYSDIATWTDQLKAIGIPYPEINAYLSIAGEFLGGLGLMIGFLTPLAALGIMAVMAVAITQVHWPYFFAKDSGFEYPLTLFVVALYFLVRGGGCLSVDALLCKKCKKSESAPLSHG